MTQTPQGDLTVPRVLIVASSPLSRAGLAALLDATDDLYVVGQSAGDDDLIEALKIYRPDVLVWDMGYEPLSLVERAADVSKTPILALVADQAAAEEAAAALIGAGVRGILLQAADRDALLAALCALARNLLVIDPVIMNALRADTTERAIDPLVEALTPRELEVVHLLAEGLPNKTIAARLDISEHTVKFHVNAIMTKLNAQSRTEAVVRATRLGLIAL